MSTVRQTVENAAIGIAVLEDRDQFTMLRQPGVAAAIWRRQLPTDFQSWVDELPLENLPCARVTVRTELVRDAVEAICANAGIPNNSKRQLLVDDAVLLATEFAALMDTEFLRLRYDVIRDDACRKFHIDAVTARLVCTYRGLGTQYGISTDGENPKRIFSAPTGAPMLLRGTKWPEPPVSGLLHRSPPIEGTDMTRLVFVIDPIFEHSSET
ncbi:MAG: DUF1826 domain-containing protein [Pseudomonadota bacterium]